ncbi:MAG TPA: hypothetical protein VJ032_00180 [Thermoanaerobaculia bacterium]|nr:hypothetical protein [Thermoanaerobaculia bacterium]
MRRVTLAVAVVAAIAVVLTFALVPPTPQDPGYHDFADQRTMLGIPNALNVLSNIGFLLVGILGLLTIRGAVPKTFFAGMLATAFGSSIYHLAPSDSTLIVDRLPMTIAFASFFLLLLDVRSVRALLAMCAAGVATIVYWLTSNDLRPYAIFQALPILTFVVTRFFAKRRDIPLWFVTAGYIAAKYCETYDRQIYALFDGIVSGHTLKHIVAAVATLAVWMWLYDDARATDAAGMRSSPGRLMTT